MSGASTKPANFGRPAWVVVNALAIFFASQLAATFLVGSAIGIFLPKRSAVDMLNNSDVAQFFFILLAEGLAAGLTIWVLSRRKLSLRAIGLRKPKVLDAWSGLKGFAAFYVLLISVSVVLSILIPDFNKTPQNVGFNNVAGTGQYWAFVSLVLLPPIGEEILVRGYLFSGLRSRMNFVKAGLITSLLFAVAHLELGDGSALVWGAAADTFVLSLVLVYLRETTGALYAGMLVHMLNNLVAFLVKYH